MASGKGTMRVIVTFFCEEDDSRDPTYEFDEAANESSDSYESEIGFHEELSHPGITESNHLPPFSEPEPQVVNSAESCDNGIHLFEGIFPTGSYNGEISEIILTQPEVFPVAPVQDDHQFTTMKQNIHSCPVELFDELPVISCESQSIPDREKEATLQHHLKFNTTAQFPVSEAKKKDLMKLCEDLQIPTVYHDFYHRLPTSQDLRVTLPEPDENEAG
ncbi:hypothetical protein GE061_017399 [Apolygus lucorum]|uniref:Uncharacterized protein n=1 Tax=Apolygus lucorum TaxID=248454 RepID=A0A8S9XB31_APOLU|nr:hypothetical protein GE061_017399 [Apolygus lucorum]